MKASQRRAVGSALRTMRCPYCNRSGSCGFCAHILGLLTGDELEYVTRYDGSQSDRILLAARQLARRERMSGSLSRD